MRRTLQDKRVHNHVSDAAASVRKAYRRASRRRAPRRSRTRSSTTIRGAVGSLRAALGLVSEPEPKPKGRKRRIATVTVIVGTVGLVAKRS